MIRQCCACKKVYDGDRWVTPRPEHLNRAEITHSYCEECREEFMRSVAEYFSVTRVELSLAARP